MYQHQTAYIPAWNALPSVFLRVAVAFAFCSKPVCSSRRQPAGGVADSPSGGQRHATRTVTHTCVVQPTCWSARMTTYTTTVLYTHSTTALRAAAAAARCSWNAPWKGQGRRRAAVAAAAAAGRQGRCHWHWGRAAWQSRWRKSRARRWGCGRWAARWAVWAARRRWSKRARRRGCLPTACA